MLLVSQDLHPKASGLLVEASGFLANMYCMDKKGPRKHKANSQRSASVKKTENRRLNYHVLLSTV